MRWKPALNAFAVERDNAVVDTQREKTHGEQRVTDLRSSFDDQLDRLRTDLDRLRTDLDRLRTDLDRLRTDLDRAQGDAREQRTRADRAEGRTP